MNKSLLLVVLFIGVGIAAQAQDPSFSQFYASRIYLNPAFTGIEQGLSFAGASRTQWSNVDQGFRTYVATVEIQEPFIRSGIGLTLFHDTQGIMQLNTTSVGISYAYHIPLEKNNLHFGLQARWVQKSVDWDRIVFSDELDPVFGDINETSAVPLLDRITFTDFDFGVVWRFDRNLQIGRFFARDTRTSIGMSIHHLPYLFLKDAGNESFQNLRTQSSPRITLHAGSVIPILFFNGTKKRIAISPNIKLDLQGEKLLSPRQHLRVSTYGLYLIYDGVYVGAFYQNKHLLPQLKNTNAFIFAFGASIKTKGRNSRNFFLGLSYDANTTGVGTRAGGVYEIALRYTLHQGLNLFGNSSGRRSSRRILDCNNFF